MADKEYEMLGKDLEDILSLYGRNKLNFANQGSSVEFH